MKLPSLRPNNRLVAVLLRTGLAIVLLYAAISELRNPGAWVFFLPAVLTSHFSGDVLLRLLAIFQLGLVTWLVSGWRIRYAAGLTALMLAGIIIANPGALDITFRDIGLTFMALALVFIQD